MEVAEAMVKRIELSIEGITAIAVLQEANAPKTVEKLWAVLPIEETLKHVRWSGAAAYILAAPLRDPSFPLENAISFYLPGTLNMRPEHGEIAIAYGRAQARDEAGNGWATHLATLEGDASAFLEAVARTHSQGQKQLKMTRVQD
jgi:hypothetical protein